LSAPGIGARQTEKDPERSTPPKLSAAEKRLQDAVKRIEGERQKRANAANVWKPGGPAARRSWKDW
jgi:hypothetical protein